MARAGMKNLWIKGGAVGSLLSLALAVWRGNRTLSRVSAGFAGAFLARWDEMRLAGKVTRILREADKRGQGIPLSAETEDTLARLWGRR
jgi:hypothetical protein